MRRKNDILLKAAFEESFPDLLRFFFPQADQIFDLQRGFTFMDKELSELFPELEKQGGSRFVDMLAKVWLRNGQSEWILVHIEIEAGTTQHFAQRMFRYYYRILDRYEVSVTAIAVFTGSLRQGKPDTYQHEFLGTHLTYRYNAYHILEHADEALLAMRNPFALVVLAAKKAQLLGKIPEEELSNQRLTIARALIDSKQYDSEQIRRFLYFLKTFLYVENPEINRIFEKEVAQLTGNETAMGIIETIKMLEREEGVYQKNQEVVRNLLQQTDFDATKIAALVGVSVDFVLTIQKELGVN